ncbi:MAG TPA: MFS transporter [Actinomycetes bacterium]|nr:MFS transporter [Actinomycetes bacterium]
MGLPRDRDLRLMLLGYGLSALGDFLALITLTIRVHDLTGSGVAVAALLLAGVLPMVLLAPVTGLVVDRFETVRVLVLTALAQAGVALALAVVHSLPPMLALAALLGTGTAIQRPAVFALLPAVAGQARLTQANALLEVAYYAGATLGPLLGGVLAEATGTSLALVIDAGTFLALAAASASLRVRRSPAPTAAPRGSGALAEARRGIGFIRSDRVLRLALAVFGGLVLGMGACNVAEVFLAKDVLGAGDAGYGALSAAWVIGMIAGVVLLARRVRPARLPVVLLAAAGTTGLAAVAVGLSPTIMVASAVYLVGGGANGIENVTMRTLIQYRVPDALRGRAYASYAAVASTAEITASGVGGGLMSLAGARGTMLVGGGVAIVVAAAGSLAYRRLPAGERAPRTAVSPPARAPRRATSGRGARRRRTAAGRAARPG